MSREGDSSMYAPVLICGRRPEPLIVEAPETGVERLLRETAALRRVVDAARELLRLNDEDASQGQMFLAWESLRNALKEIR